MSSYTRWIVSSINKHFRDAIEANNQPMPVWTLLESKPENLQTDRFELIHSGPDFKTGDSTTLIVSLSLNLGVFTQISAGNISAHLEAVDLGVSAFTNCISVKRFGQYAEDDKSTVFSLRLKGAVSTDFFGRMSPEIPLNLTTVTQTMKAQSTYKDQQKWLYAI